MSYAEKRRILNKAVSDWVDVYGNTRCVDENGREALVQKAIEARPPGAYKSRQIASDRVSNILGKTRKIINNMQRQNGRSIGENTRTSKEEEKKINIKVLYNTSFHALHHYLYTLLTINNPNQ